MALITLSTIPGFSDLGTTPLASGKFALGVHLARVNQNASFGLVRTEVFSGLYKHGDTVPVPTSAVDGYTYKRNEMMYLWTPQNTADPVSNWASYREPWTMWYGIWNVNQLTGTVLSEIGYRGNNDNKDKTASTNDGQVQVFVVAQRQQTNLIMASIPAFTKRIDADFYTDRPLHTGTILNVLSSDAKFGVVNSEVMYMGEFTNGQTVPKPVSPADGRVYAYAEVTFQTSWRWTADTDGSGNPIKPAINKGQLQDWAASVDVSGIVRITNQHVFYELFGRNSYATGKVAVFAFCSRPLGTTFATIQNSFAELPDTTFAPGATLRASTLQKLNKNINQAVCSPEFFAATNYTNGASIPLPTSPLDGYTYARSELSYIWDWADTGPDPTNTGRLCLVRGGVDASGNVSIDKYRLRSGAGTVTLSHEGSLRVIVFGKRANSNAIVTPVVLTAPDWAGDPIGDRWGDIVDGTGDGSKLLNTIQVSGKPRSISTLIDMGSGQVGANLLENGSFEILADTVSGDTLAAGWVNTLANNTQFSINLGFPGDFYSGTHALVIDVAGGYTIGAGNGYVNIFKSYRQIPVKPGEVYFARAQMLATASIGMPAGLLCAQEMDIELVSALGGITDFLIGELVNADVSGGWKQKSGATVIPALCGDGSLPAYIRIYLRASVTNPTGAGIVIGVGIPFAAHFDNVELYRSVNPISDEILKFGSMPPSFAGTISYSSTPTVITWSWNVNIYRTDNGATVVNMNSSQAVTGLTGSTLYYWYPLMDEADLSFKMVTTGGTGSPAWAHTTTSRVWSVEQARADHVPLSSGPLQVTTPSSGSGGGSGPPPDEGCLLKGTFVKEKMKGVIACELLEVDDYIWSENDTWLRVKAVRIERHDLWIAIGFNCGQELVVTAGHPFTLRDRSVKRAHDLCLTDEVPCSTGVAHPETIRLIKREGFKVPIECESPHTFFAAVNPDGVWVLTHNMVYSTL